MKMAELSSIEQERKPTVRVIACQIGERELSPILWGLEEEGIPSEVQSVSGGEAVALARQAAQMSALNVGVALHGGEGKAVLHHRDLAEGAPLFTLPLQGVESFRLRLLGMNAARLVKGEPLLFGEEPVTAASADDPPEVAFERQACGLRPGSEELLEVVVRTVIELLGKG
ncbi:MAG: hypothetical protein CXZ00_14065 [Acidobacteria bacterium]|nr:MAG: hypothetical protein CXZ00_14065 [Acidobacteriota bacterium]